MTPLHAKPINKAAAIVVSRGEAPPEFSTDKCSVRPFGATYQNAPDIKPVPYKFSGVKVGSMTAICLTPNGYVLSRCNCGSFEYRTKTWFGRWKDAKRGAPSLIDCAMCEARRRTIDEAKPKTQEVIDAKEWRKQMKAQGVAMNTSRMLPGGVVDGSAKGKGKAKHRIIGGQE